MHILPGRRVSLRKVYDMAHKAHNENDFLPRSLNGPILRSGLASVGILLAVAACGSNGNSYSSSEACLAECTASIRIQVKQEDGLMNSPYPVALRPQFLEKTKGPIAIASAEGFNATSKDPQSKPSSSQIPLYAFFGAVLGATIGALTTWWTTRINLQTSRKISLLDIRREEYFKAMEIVHRMEKALKEMASATEGREEPGILASKSRKKEAKDRDQRSADAVVRLYEAYEELRSEVYRLMAVGSVQVSLGLQTLSDNLLNYLRDAFERPDGMFIAADFNQAMNQYAQDMEAFIREVRQDLNVDESVK